MRFSVSDADVLKGRELYNRCTLDLWICRRGDNIPSPRKKKCPVTPCVRARLD
ncbi:hypothetical protein BDW02DRAFT_571741 [Decorospora gaudefroyi]|uniref:Uncharacterized protein n=1 Tax=Decorospora gaudefroyi TaxID=184978 RepID=A0A6A5K9P5_9PLEO|nr:hypothetical protein BDW02DRAFT_571741 [Decorospora gaudefroyi]